MKASENQKSTIHKKSQSVDLLNKKNIKHETTTSSTTKNKFNSPSYRTTNKKDLTLQTNLNNNNNNNSSNYNSPTFNKTFLNLNSLNSTIKKTKNNSNNYNCMSNTSTCTSNFLTNTYHNNHKKTSSNFQLCEFQRKFTLENPGDIPYDNYHKSTRNIMAEYKYEALADNAVNLLEKRLFIEDENFDKMQKEIFKKLNNKQFLVESTSPDAKMKVSVYGEDYKSPEKAFGVIWKNKIIHESMIRNYHERQKTQYVDFLRKVCENEKFSNTTLKRLKVTNSLVGNKGLDMDGFGGNSNNSVNVNGNIVNNFNNGSNGGIGNFDYTLSNGNLHAAEDISMIGTPQGKSSSKNFTAGVLTPINKSNFN